MKVGRGAEQNLKKGLSYIGGPHREVIRKVRNPLPAVTYIDIFT